ncbi:MAG: DUF5916 domain-containing protein [Bacteroidota bacterium]
MRRVILLFALVVFSCKVSGAADSLYARRTYAPVRISETPPVIDGILDDQVWNEGEWAGGFVQHEPYDGRKPSQETDFKILFDKNFIYVAVRAWDTAPDSIVRRLTRRDEIDGDIVAVQFDSYHDLRTGFTFFVGVGGTRGDMIMSNDGQNEDETWDPVWWVKTSTDNKGWFAEIKIPFSQLRFDKNGDDTWGLQIARVIYRKDETSLWQPIRRDAPGWIHLLGSMTGMNGISPKKQAEIIPYAVGGYEHYEPEEGNPYAPGTGFLGNAGLDAKIGLTNNLTLDLSINPDFGQVEADPSEVNLSAFETYFEEKRPFFIEGKNILSYSIIGDGDMGSESLFYSRRIGKRPNYEPDLADNEYIDQPEFTRILGAAKITGKTSGGLSVGILESVTAPEYARISLDGEERTMAVEPLTNYLVGRVSKDFNKGNTILGGMITSTNRKLTEDHLFYLPENALTGGVDFIQYFNEKKYYLKLTTSFSHVQGSEEAITELQTASARYYQRPDASYVHLDSSRTALSGYGGNLQFYKISGKLNFMASVGWKSPGLELNDVGFLRYADEILQVCWIGYRTIEPFSIFRTVNFNLSQWHEMDFGGRTGLDGLNFSTHANFKNYWEFALATEVEGNMRYNSYLWGGPSMYLPGEFGLLVNLESDSRKKLRADAVYHIRRGMEKQLKRNIYALELEYRPGSLLSLGLEPEYSSKFSELQFIDIIENNAGNRYLFGSIDQRVLSLSLRINLTITPELTVQYWGQPFIASGNFTDFKVITDPKAAAYTDRFHVFDATEITYLPEDELYRVTESGTAYPEYTFDNPDFSFKEFLSNLVLRWEYRPGSVVYLVWSQNREQSDVSDIFSLMDNGRELWEIYPRNTFMVKFSYRIGN